MQAVAHIPAAVVNPLIPFDVFKIAPAPKNPIPDNTWAVNLAGSLLVCELYWKNKAKDVIDVIHEPIDTKMWVLNPANWCDFSLSNPVNPPITKAIINLIIILSLVIIIITPYYFYHLFKFLKLNFINSI